MSSVSFCNERLSLGLLRASEPAAEILSAASVELKDFALFYCTNQELASKH